MTVGLLDPSDLHVGDFPSDPTKSGPRLAAEARGLADAVVRGDRGAGCVPRVRSIRYVTGHIIMADGGYRTV